MSRLGSPRRVRAEDFEAEDRNLISKLAFPINSLADELYGVLNKSLDFNNLNRDLTVITIKTGASSELLGSPQFKHNLRSKLAGINCIKAENLLNPTVYPTGTPFISFTFNENIVSILNITNLQSNSEYRLTLELIGENV